MPEPDHRLRALGATLRKARRDQDISQEVLAERAGLHRNIVGRVEHGDRDVRVSTILKLIDGLGLDAAEVFSAYDARRRSAD